MSAHFQLPLGTKVKVTREDTDESVIVVINDLQPFKKGTVINLAHEVSDALELDETAEAAVVSRKLVDYPARHEPWRDEMSPSFGGASLERFHLNEMSDV